MSNYTDIENFIKQLDSYQIQYLMSFAKDRIKKLMRYGRYGRKDKPITRLEISENRFKKGLKCPKCGSVNLNKNGISNNKQRYICKDCRKTFDEMSNSPLSSTKLSTGKWLNYCKCMVMGGSIRECARQVSVSIPTSFYMRHRILDILNKELSNVILEGVIQINQYLIEESFKGQKNNFNRNKINPEYIYNSEFTIARRLFHVNYEGKICVQTAIDINGQILSRAISRGRPSEEDIKKFFENRMKDNSICCIPRCNKNFHMQSLRNKSRKKIVGFFGFKEVPVYNVNKVNTYFREFDTWLKQFYGVSSKYLNNYLSWFKFLEISKNKFEYSVIKGLFLDFIGSDTKLTQKEIKHRKIDLLY